MAKKLTLQLRSNALDLDHIITSVLILFLRLNSKECEKQLANFNVLYDKMFVDYKKQLQQKTFNAKMITFEPKVIDFRIPELAFIK